MHNGCGHQMLNGKYGLVRPAMRSGCVLPLTSVSSEECSVCSYWSWKADMFSFGNLKQRVCGGWVWCEFWESVNVGQAKKCQAASRHHSALTARWCFYYVPGDECHAAGGDMSVSAWMFCNKAMRCDNQCNHNWILGYKWLAAIAAFMLA